MNARKTSALGRTQGFALLIVLTMTALGQPAFAADINVPGAIFPMPSAWESEQPASRMRLAQAKISGDGGDAQMAVFFFGAGGGGGVEANLKRWEGQMEASAPAERDTMVVGTWTVHWVEVPGTLKPSTMGTGPTEPQPNYRLLAAVVAGEGGPWFFKVTGPDATVKNARGDFFDMLKKGRPSN